MFPYENVKSIHNQKMAQFIAERDRDLLVRTLKAGKPSQIKRLGDAAGDMLTSVQRAISVRVRPAF